jgi:hypothetical protein
MDVRRLRPHPGAKFNLEGFADVLALRGDRSRPRGAPERHIDLGECERAIEFLGRRSAARVPIVPHA